MSLLSRFRGLFGRTVENQLDEEIQSHIEMRAELNMRQGMSPQEARRDAIRRFGNVTWMKEETRRADIVEWVESAMQDLRYAMRILLRSRAFAAVALITLALGIGSTTAMFSVVNGVLLRPLPYPDPERLVAINEYNTSRPMPDIPLGQLSYPDFDDIATRSHSFDSIAAYTFVESTVTGLGPAFHVNGEIISPAIFTVLRVQPALGRAFTNEENQPGHHVAIVSDRFWRTHFGGDPAVLGRALSLDGNSYTIVGVMPPGFQFVPQTEPRDVWTTFSRWAEMGGGKSTPPTKQRGNHSIFGIARLKAGITVEAANTELASIARSLAVEFPDKNRHVGIAAVPELRYLVGDSKNPLLVLMGAVGLVLLVACANVANLLLARGAGRGREIAVRAALGATRLRVLRQLIVESVLLSATGALLGIGFAQFALVGVLKLYPENLPRAATVAIDLRVLLFTTAIAIGTGLLFGLMPAWRLSRANLTYAIREGRGTSTAGRTHDRIRSALIVAETALGVVLLVGAGLLIRSFQRLSGVELGFDPHHLVAAQFDTARGTTTVTRNRMLTDLMSRVRALPGVQSAAASMPLPLAGNDMWSVGFNVLDHPVPESEYPHASFYLVTDGFFQTMQIPLLRGRVFDQRDSINSPPVMIITETLAKRYFRDEDPIGRKIYMGASDGREEYQTREIVGVVGDIRRTNLKFAPTAAFYVPISQMMWGMPTIVVRTDRRADALRPDLGQSLASVDPDAPLYDVRSMEEWFALDLGHSRFQTILLGLFAAIALLLTAVGLYGVVAYTVAQRTQEIGLRMALGASRATVLWMVLRRGLQLIATGIGIGLVGAFASGKVVQAMLYQTATRDLPTYITVSGVLAAVALIASYVPARKASTVDPMVALRYE